MITPPRAAVRRLALGRLISLTGTYAAGTALTFSIYDRTGSALGIAGTMLLTWGLVDLLAPLGGALGDRFDRRRLMIGSELASAACWSVMVMLDETSALLAVAFIASVVEVPYFPSSGAAIPNVAGMENLAWANSLVSMGSNAGLTLGPMLGGLIVATVGARLVFAANAASYAVSVALTMSVHARFSDPESRTEAERREHRGIVAGFRFVRNDRVLRTMAVSWFAFIL
ncbi:MAG: MFS transporter, partial [Actinomycetota bacterium]